MNQFTEKYVEVDEILSSNIFNSKKIRFYSAEHNVDGSSVEILSIKYDNETKQIIERIIKNNIKPLIDSNNQGIQKIINVDEDEKSFYIIYENLDESKEYDFSKHDLEQCVNMLERLKHENRQGFILNQQTVIKTSGKGIKIRFIGLFELFQKLNIDFNENIKEKRRINDDIKSLAHLFEVFLKKNDKTQEIFNNCINEKYNKYSKLKEDIKKIPYERNPNFNLIGVAVNDNKCSIDNILYELNNGCYWKTQTELSKKDEITVEWCTEEISGTAYVSEESEHHCYLFIPYINDYPNHKILDNGERAPFNFIDYREIGGKKIDYFSDKFEEYNKLAILDQSKSDIINEWKALPEKEKEYIEEKAFKTKYIERKISKSNKLNIIFTLDGEFKDWDTIKEKKHDEIMLSINEVFIGKILDYKPKENKLTIQDCREELDNISEQGELIEDVWQETSQYKKQVESCEKLKKKDIINPELAGFLATPERMPGNLSHIDIPYDSFEIINDNLKTDKTQKDAVIEALYKNPIYLIQGPPGTGKTTVIVELVKQLIKQNKDMKILVVSQSNMAVDNVLKRLSNDILFMRLASDKANISDGISQHLFENKLRDWGNETIKKSENYLKDKFPKSNDLLLNLYNTYKMKDIKNIDSFKKLYKNKGIMASYFEKLFVKTTDLKKVNEIFHKEIGEEYIKLSNIQKDWLAFIRNAEKSTLKCGSNDIDLQTAFAKSMNVLGSTCIHIANSKYSNINFQFDYMIMDEASKATAAEALVPITMSKNLILIGDHKQLPPIITREESVREKIKEKLEDEGLDIDKTYGVSLFEKLFKEFKKSNQLESYKTMLDIQYRMPRQLGYLISKYIYDNELKSPPLERLSNYDALKSHHLSLKTSTITIDNDKKIPNSIIFITTSEYKKPYDNDNKYLRKNSCNVDVIQNILKNLNNLYKNKKEFISDIGIIATYRGQVELLKSEILCEQYSIFKEKIDINTVDQFQGSERDIIIYDIVKSSKNPSNIGFLDDFRRINVAFSRARKLLIIVGDSEYILKRATLNPHSNFEKLIIKSMVQQLKEWGCIYNSIEEAIDERSKV